MRFVAPSLVALATAVFVAAQPSTPELSAGPPSVLPELRTNAKRFAAGLPPLPPKHRHRSHTPNGGKSPVLLVVVFQGSKTDTTRRAVASPSLPVVTGCNILVRKVTDGSTLGYLARAAGRHRYGLLQPVQTSSLLVSFPYTPNDPTSLSEIDIIATNGLNANYPYFGGMTAANFRDLGPTGSGFAYIGATVQTPKGSPPTQANNSFSANSKVESGIWKFDPVTQVISAQWINGDGSLPTTYLGYRTNTLYISGNLPSIGGGIVEVNLICVPPVSPQVSK